MHSDTFDYGDRRQRIMPVASCWLLVLNFVAAAVPLGNWRLPFFRLASDFELSCGAPSRMFWDFIASAELFDSAIWPPNAAAGTNYWMIEPAVTTGATYPAAAETDKHLFLSGALYHEARYGCIRIGQSLDVDSRFNQDVFYPAHRDRFAQGRIEEAFLQIDWRNGFLRIGRQQRSWGPFPDRSLILSANPYSYDAVEWQLFGSFFEFRHLFAPFSLIRSSWDADDGTSRDRYLTAHSLNFILGKWVTVGVVESVLFTRSRGFPDLQYVNPVSIYSVVNTNQEGDGNLLLGFQWNIHPGTERISLRGQVVFDDFQVDDELVTDQEPAHWGIDAGIFWYDPVGVLPLRHLLKLEFTHASPWLYTVPDDNARRAERYIYGGKSLGLSFNDGSRLRVEALAILKRYGAFGFSVEYSQRGGNTELTSWLDSEHIPGLPFDTGAPVERRCAAGGEGYWYFRDYVHLCMGGSLGWTRNHNNLPSDDYRFDPEVSVELSIHFCDFSIRLP